MHHCVNRVDLGCTLDHTHTDAQPADRWVKVFQSNSPTLRGRHLLLLHCAVRRN